MSTGHRCASWCRAWRSSDPSCRCTRSPPPPTPVRGCPLSTVGCVRERERGLVGSNLNGQTYTPLHHSARPLTQFADKGRRRASRCGGGVLHAGHGDAGVQPGGLPGQHAGHCSALRRPAVRSSEHGWVAGWRHRHGRSGNHRGAHGLVDTCVPNHGALHWVGRRRRRVWPTLPGRWLASSDGVGPGVFSLTTLGAWMQTVVYVVGLVAFNLMCTAERVFE